MFKLSHLQSTLHLMQYTYPDFLSLLKTVFRLVDFDTVQRSCHFLFHLFHIGKMFSFRNFFIQGNNKKGHSQWDWVNREGGVWGHAVFDQKLLNTQCGVDRYPPKLPIMKQAKALK